MFKNFINPSFLNISFIISIVFLVYFQGLNSQFQFDDFPNIVENKRLHIQSLSLEDISKATLSGNSGSFLQRPISMFSFALNYYYSKLSPYPYKLTNLVIHIINSIGIYWLSFLLFKKANMTKIVLPSLAITLAWAVHPINLTSVLYVVQRMASLSAFFVIISMILYFYAKNNLHKNNFKIGIFCLLGILIFACCSISSKENGALVFVYLLLLELIFFQDFSSSNSKIRFTSIIFFTLTLAIPLLFISAYSIINPEWITAHYVSSNFNLSERLLTESRVVWNYILWILLPSNQSLGLMHDDFVISHQLFDDTLPILAILAHGVLISALIYLWSKKKQPFFVFGCALFYCSHLIESTIIPLELVHEHRNYLGSFGLLLAALSPLLNLEREKTSLLHISIPIYIVFLALLTTQRAMTWGNGLESALIEVAHHPKSAAAHYELGRQYRVARSEDFEKKSIKHFKVAAELDKTRADGLFAILIAQSSKNLPIESDLLNEINNRLRNGPVYASHTTWLSVLVSCYTRAKCHMKETELVSIVQATLANKKLQHHKLTESFALMVTSGLLTSGRENYQNALELSIIAANSSPGNIIFIKHIINLALNFKDVKTAAKWIKHFEAQSYAHLSRKEIRTLKEELADIILDK